MKKYFSYVYMGILTICVFVYMFSLKSNTVYVNMGDVVDEYHMKNDLENLLNEEISNRKTGLDIILRQMDSIKDIDSSEYLKYKRYHMDSSEKLNAFRQSKTKEIEGQIINRINEGTIKFGDMNGYDYILGANGNGSIMYAGDHKNVTDELILFLNNEYGK